VQGCGLGGYMMFVAGFALFLLGIIFVICYPINKRKNKRCSEQVQGTLVDIRRHRNSQGNVSHSYVYSYAVQDVEYRITSTIISKEAHNVGDTCTIWYNPKKPKDAQPFHYGSNKPYTIVLIIGIAMILLGFVLFVIGSATM
jgi:uncharacterized membrane protein